MKDRIAPPVKSCFGTARATQTLLDVLQRRVPDSSNTTIRKMPHSDSVRVNGAPESDRGRRSAREGKRSRTTA